MNVRGVSIFHAGDLNDWKMEHVGELINGKTGAAFRHEIRKLADKPVNFAFVPMDPRLGPYQTLGIDFVLKNTECRICFPDAYVAGLFCNQGIQKTHYKSWNGRPRN